MSQLVLKYVPILTVRELCRHLDWYTDLWTVFGCQVAHINFFDDTKHVLEPREHQKGVIRPGQASIVLNNELLLDLLICLHFVVVRVLDTHNSHWCCVSSLLTHRLAQLALLVLHGCIAFRKGHMIGWVSGTTSLLLRMVITVSLAHDLWCIVGIVVITVLLTQLLWCIAGIAPVRVRLTWIA